MKTTLKFLIIGTLVVNVSCNSDNWYEKSPISGSLVLRDDIGENIDRIPALVDVQIGEQGSDSYLYSVKSDASGKFSFDYLPKGKHTKYWCRAVYTETTGTYKDSVMVTTDGSLVLKLQPQYKNGIKVKVSYKNEPMNGVAVSLFVNSALAESARSASSITGNVSTITTNLRGVGLFPNLADMDYYVLLKSTLPKKDTLLTKRRPNAGNSIIANTIEVKLD